MFVSATTRLLCCRFRFQYETDIPLRIKKLGEIGLTAILVSFETGARIFSASAKIRRPVDRPCHATVTDGQITSGRPTNSEGNPSLCERPSTSDFVNISVSFGTGSEARVSNETQALGRKAFTLTLDCKSTPTVLAGHNRMRVFQEEIFGPVVSVTTFKDDEVALHIARSGRVNPPALTVCL
jgi:Aldehyde dehydrogenase family